MSAPTPTFRSAIADYRQWLNRAEIDEQERLFALTILKRWAEHSDTEKVWDTIRRELPSEAVPTAKDFITYVLERAWDLQRELGDRIPQFPSLEDGIDRHRKDGDYIIMAAASAAVDQFNKR